MDLDKTQRELTRWLILQTLNVARPYGASDQLLVAALNDARSRVTMHELRRELDYLEERALIEISGRGEPHWVAKLTRAGVDVVEYTIPCEPGIARPAKYW